MSRIPRLLPSCGHTICSLCAFQVLRNSNKLICPKDNVEFYI